MKTRDLKYIRSATTTLCAGFHFEQGKERTGSRGTDSSRAPETPRTAQGMGHISPSCTTASNVLDVKQEHGCISYFFPNTKWCIHQSAQTD